MHIFSAQETADHLTYLELAEEIMRVLADCEAGRVGAPERIHHPLPNGGTLLVMPASGRRIAVTKLVTFHPDNTAHNLPAIQGELVVMDAGTGRRLGILHGETVTMRRTAALTLAAARALAPDNTGPLLMIGSGAQARAHVEALWHGQNVTKVYVWSRNPAHAEKLAIYASSLGMKSRTVADPAEVAERTPLVVSATSSTDPVVPECVPDNCFVAAIGAFTPEMAEVGPKLIARASLYVDTLDGARASAGDLIRAGVDWERVVPLVHAADNPPREGAPVLFKSVGHALFDLAAARLAFP